MIFERPVEIDDGPIMDNSRGDGLVRIYNPDQEFVICLSRRDIDFLQSDLAQAVSFIGQDMTREIPPLYFPEAAVLRAKADKDWLPPQMGLIWPKYATDKPIRLVVCRLGETWPEQYINFENKQSLDNFRLMLGYMKHLDSRLFVQGKPRDSGISTEIVDSAASEDAPEKAEPLNLFQQVEEILNNLEG